MRFVLVTVAFFAFAGAGVAADAKPVDITREILGHCGTIPFGTTFTIDPKTATKEMMENARRQVIAFAEQADKYQKCLLNLAGTLSERLSEDDKKLIVAAIDRSQQEKEVTANDYNKLVDQYNASHH